MERELRINAEIVGKSEAHRLTRGSMQKIFSETSGPLRLTHNLRLYLLLSTLCQPNLLMTSWRL